MNEKVSKEENQGVGVFNHRQCWMEPTDSCKFTLLTIRLKGTIMNLRCRGVTMAKEPLFSITAHIYVLKRTRTFLIVLVMDESGHGNNGLTKIKRLSMPLFKENLFS